MLYVALGSITASKLLTGGDHNSIITSVSVIGGWKQDSCCIWPPKYGQCFNGRRPGSGHLEKLNLIVCLDFLSAYTGLITQCAYTGWLCTVAKVSELGIWIPQFLTSRFPRGLKLFSLRRVAKTGAKG